MISVLYVVSTLKRTGPNNVLFNLISELDRSILEAKILTLSPEENNFPSLWDDFVALGVGVYSLNLTRLNGFIGGRSSLKKFVFEQNIEIIHMYGFRGDLLVRKKDFKNLKIVSTINSNIYDDYTMLYGKIKGSIMAYLHIKSLRGKISIGCSSFVAEQLFKRYNTKLGVIRNGIPKQLYRIASLNEKIEIRTQTDLPLAKKIFIFVGYLIDRKDPLTVIRGFIDSQSNNESFLLMIGDGPLMESCKYLVRDRVDIKFLGNQPETLKFLKASDFYISAAHSEGLPTSVMEAMGCGLPVILSEIDPHEELLSKIDNWEYTFPVGDYGLLSNKIVKIVDEDYKALALQFRSVIENDINSSVMANEYQKIYLTN